MGFDEEIKEYFRYGYDKAIKKEASYFDRINMTKNGLDYAKKIPTVERERWNLTERLHRRTLTVEHDQNMDEYDRKYLKKNH